MFVSLLEGPLSEAVDCLRLQASYADRNRSALLTTDTELNDIAAAAIRGESSTPKNG